jgi:hypothetical protein
MAIHVKDIDTSQADFQTGTLTDVEADAGDYLRLVDTPVLSFDGVNDCVELPSLNRFDPYTIEFWVKLSSDDPGNSFFSDWDGNDYTTFRVPNGRIEFGLYDGTSRVWTPESSISILDEWHHCCGINNGSEIKLYLDGGLVGSTPHSLVISTNAFLVMEDATAGTPNYAKGNICDIRFWDHERTPTEIQDNMYKRLNGDEPGLVAYYKLDEGTGTVATDSAGTNDGTINGATWKPSYVVWGDGNRISPQLDLSAVGMVESSSVSWAQTLNGGAIAIETRISTDNGATWSAWKPCTNGGAIPDLPYGTDVSTALLECRQSLSTSDPTVTPQLESITVKVSGELSGEFGSFFAFPF